MTEVSEVSSSWSDDELADYDDDDDNSEVFDEPMSDHAESTGPSWTKPSPAAYLIGRQDQMLDSRVEERNFDVSSVYGRKQVLETDPNASDGPQFRLLRIYPDELSLPIHCELITRAIYDDTLSFTALSYSWGTGRALRTILIGNTFLSFPVSNHLWNALRRLRDAKKVVHVWVDAICINQRNLVDKAAQVQIMAQIYNAASEVKIWLGEVEAIDARDESEFELFWGLCRQDRPWWKRLWIIQECAHARECPVVMLGNLTTSLMEFTQRWRTAILLQSPPTADDLVRQEVLLDHLEFLDMPLNAWRRQVESNVLRLPLLQRLRETFGRQFSDPCDRVYAILSLVTEKEAQKISPDYRRPYSELRAEIEGLLKQSTLWDDVRDRDLLEVNNQHESTWADKIAIAADQDDETRVRGILLAGLVPVASCAFIFRKALREGRIKTAKVLFDEGLTLHNNNDEDRHLINVLVKASESGRSDEVKLLLDAGVNANGRNGRALYQASRGGHIQVAGLLLNAGANASVRGTFVDDPLVIASRRGDRAMVKLLVDAGANVNSGGDPLCAAVAEGHQEVVRLLIDACAGINTDDGRPLHIASARGSYEMVEILLGAGADVNALDTEYCTPLIIASTKPYSKTVSLLLDAGADVNAQSEKSWFNNALYAASYHGHTKIVNLLLRAGADVNIAGGRYSKPLYVASTRGHYGTVQQLLNAGAIIDSRWSEICETVSSEGHHAVVKLLQHAQKMQRSKAIAS